MTIDVPIEADLAAAVNAGEMNEWQAMQAQTCRDAAYARAKSDELAKKVEELESCRETPAPQSPVRLVTRG